MFMRQVCACPVSGRGICRRMVPIQILHTVSANSLSAAGLWSRFVQEACACLVCAVSLCLAMKCSSFCSRFLHTLPLQSFCAYSGCAAGFFSKFVHVQFGQ